MRAGCAGGGVEIGRAKRVLAEGYAGQHHPAGAEGRKAAHKRLDLLPVLRAVPVRLVQEQRSLGQVGHDQVGLRAELAHARGEILRKVGIKPAVVGHHRVDGDEGSLPLQRVECLQHDVDLPEGAEIARVDGVKAEAEALPMAHDGQDVVRQIPERVAGESARVGGQHRRRNGADLRAHRRNHRKGHRQGAFSKAGDVMDRGDPLQIGHKTTSYPNSVQLFAFDPGRPPLSAA